MASKDRDEKYAYLNQFDTEQLEELLRLESDSPEGGDEAMIDYILEVIVRRERANPTGAIPDVEKAWAEFQTYYNIPEGDGISLYLTQFPEGQPCCKPKPAAGGVRRRGLVAAVAGVILFSVVMAQAIGIDVLGALSRWSGELFHFTSPAGRSAPVENERNEHYCLMIQYALDDCGIAEDLAPTWYPDGFETAGPVISKNKDENIIFCDFSNDTGKFFSIRIHDYGAMLNTEKQDFEKDPDSVEVYSASGKVFYTLSNSNSKTATWSDGEALVMAISGNFSEEELIAIIDSIGG